MKLFGSFVERRAELGIGEFTIRPHQRSGDVPRDLVANIKNIAHMPVVPVRPNLAPRARINQLRRYTDVLIGVLDGALNDIVDMKLSAHLANIYRLVLVAQCRVASHDQKIWKLGQRRRQLFGNSVGKVLLIACRT